MFIVEIGAVFTTVLAIADPSRVRLGDHRLAVADRALRQPGRGGRRGPGQGPGRHPAAGQEGHHRPPADRLDAGRRAERLPRGGGAGRRSCSRATSSWSRPARSSPATATSSRASPASTSRPSPASPRPVIRESGGDRSAVTGGTKVLSDRIVVQDHPEAGGELHRPDDRPGRGRQPAEDAERDRAEHPARRAHDHLPAGRGRPCSRWRSSPRRYQAAAPDTRRDHRRRRHRHRAGVAAGLPDPDHDRRAAVGDRHRRHGPAGAAQRAGDERPGGRGGRRRQHPAAGQDRHHHPGQPAGRRVPPGRRASTAETLADAAQLSSLADETPEGRSIVVLRQERATGCGSASPA